MTLSQYIQCPQTHSPLVAVDGYAVCKENPSIKYEMTEGVIDFASSSYESMEIERELEAMISTARSVGCVEAIKTHGGDKAYLFDEIRRRYIELPELRPTDIVLEIGSSLGQHTRHIAKSCAHVEGLDVVKGQAIFANLFCQQDGHQNVNVSAGGVDGVLPFKDASFDVVFFNYVLEWCAGRSEIHPRQFHLKLLKECQRVLKPGGKLVLTTKNRHNLRLFAGAYDEHLEFRFGSALPRWAANQILKIRATKKPPGYLHSQSEMERLLHDAGLVKLRSFLALPDARYPQFMETFDRNGIAKMKANYSDIEKRKMIAAFLTLPFFLQKKVAPSHVYLCERD